MSLIYVIEELWTDSLENHSTNAMGYKAVYAVATEAQAQAIVNAASIILPDRCWAIPKNGTPKKRYFSLKLK